MIRGMYTALSGMIVDEKKQSVISNNMSNANTPGYKAKRLNSKTFEQVMLSNKDTVKGSGRNELGYTSFGVEIDDVTTEHIQGAFQNTEVATDFAIEGEGYFVVKDENGQKFYTRNGSFMKNLKGYLVDSNGNNVIARDENGEESEIFVGNKELTVNHKGEIYLNDQYESNFKFVDFDKKENLVKFGDNLYITNEKEIDNNPIVKQGNLEMSNVSLTDEYANMISAYRSFESNYKVLSKLNETLGKSVNDIGKVR